MRTVTAWRAARSVARSGGREERERLGVVLDLATDRDEDRLVGLDRADDVVARDVGGGHDDDRAPVEPRVELERDEPRVRLGRADRGAEPGAREDEVVGVHGGAGELGRALAPERSARRAPVRARPSRAGRRPGWAPRSASSGRAPAILHRVLTLSPRTIGGRDRDRDHRPMVRDGRRLDTWGQDPARAGHPRANPSR